MRVGWACLLVISNVHSDTRTPPCCKQDDERFNLSAQEYLERYHIQVYVNDCIRTILDTREDRPLETALKYFNSVLQVCERYSKGSL